MRENKEVIIYAGFRAQTPLEILQRFIKTGKDEWLQTFAEYDFYSINRVTANQFLEGIQVSFSSNSFCLYKKNFRFPISISKFEIL